MRSTYSHKILEEVSCASPSHLGTRTVHFRDQVSQVHRSSAGLVQRSLSRHDFLLDQTEMTGVLREVHGLLLLTLVWSNVDLFILVFGTGGASFSSHCGCEVFDAVSSSTIGRVGNCG